MPGSGDLAEPVSYSPWLGVVAVVLPLLVVAWYAGVALWARGRLGLVVPQRVRLAATRRRHLGRIEQIRRDVEAGRLPVREAHQQLGTVVRSFVAEAGPVDARPLTLAQLRGDGSPGLADVADVVELVYPPSFRPGDEGRPVEQLAPALQRARELVSGWRP